MRTPALSHHKRVFALRSLVTYVEHEYIAAFSRERHAGGRH